MLHRKHASRLGQWSDVGEVIPGSMALCRKLSVPQGETQQTSPVERHKIKYPAPCPYAVRDETRMTSPRERHKIEYHAPWPYA
eukprot:scaffold23455_cov94-Skeletonema_dohrnii-CCMP3373.AAC.1